MNNYMLSRQEINANAWVEEYTDQPLQYSMDGHEFYKTIYICFSTEQIFD